MSLYNRRFDFDFSFEKIKMPLLGLIIVILIVLAFFLLNSAFQPKPLIIILKNNPLIIGKNNENYTVLSVTITNTTKENATNSELIIEPIDKTAIRISDDVIKKEVIPVLGVNESRTLKFIVAPLDSEKILEGNYKIKTQLKINNKVFSNETVLAIKK